MNSLSRLIVLAGLLLQVQAAPRGSPLGSRRLGHQNTESPTPAPTRKKHLYSNVDNLNNRVEEDDADWVTTPAPTTSPTPPTFHANWGAPTPTVHDKNTPWIDIDGDDDGDDDGGDDGGTTPTDVIITPAPVSSPVVFGPPVPTAFPVPAPVPVRRTRRPTPVPTLPPTVAQAALPTVALPGVSATAFPTVALPGVSATAFPTFPGVPATAFPTPPGFTATSFPTLDLSKYWTPDPTASRTAAPTSFGETASPSEAPSSAPNIGTFAPVQVIPIDFGSIGHLPTLSFTSRPSAVPSVSPTTSAPSSAPTVFSAMPTEDNTMWTPLKTFDLQLSRDTRWNTQFAPDELRQGLETYLTESMMILSADMTNVTLTIFTSAFNEDKSEAWFRFQGKLFYLPKSEDMEISSDEVWAQQMALLENMDALQWILQNQPTMAAGFVTIKQLAFLDGSSTQTFDGYSGGSSSALDQTTKIVIAVAAILLILACSVGVYICMFLDPEPEEEPLPIQTKLTPHTDSDFSIGKGLPGNPHVPEVTFDQESHSEMSSITELRADDPRPDIPGASSVDAIASNDSRLVPLSSLPADSSHLSSSSNNSQQYRTTDSVQLSQSEWSMAAGNTDPPAHTSALGPEASEQGSVEDLYVTSDAK
ncbi:hypothetical protein FisN_30Lh100 [Fistulifera solaris]|uniref:SEA domain-containing protein n=1 Tax=Fistulifera solaris TaxID=1519565 RepID=A0A1Z5JIP8_FISSO|nr:hypothetical protein FisN_30Lh100 [Fistulifera solaris]|eukprot:GAX13806.1 hypothetical protein FisN_30Lh100 [Fistulifera solaris]